MFADASGTLVAEASATEEPCGFAEVHGVKCVALYAADGRLFVQIDARRFAIGEAKLAYRHQWEEGTTTFSAEGGGTRADVTYPAWWAEAGVDQWELRSVP